MALSVTDIVEWGSSRRECQKLQNVMMNNPAKNMGKGPTGRVEREEEDGTRLLLADVVPSDRGD